MAVFRVLLNLLVILVLPLAGGLPEALAFSLAAGMLLLCLALSGILRQAETSAHGKEGHVLVRLIASDRLGSPRTASTCLYLPLLTSDRLSIIRYEPMIPTPSPAPRPTTPNLFMRRRTRRDWNSPPSRALRYYLALEILPRP